VWYAGGGWRVVTAMHTYATPGEYYITLTVNDTHPGGMSPGLTLGPVLGAVGRAWLRAARGAGSTANPVGL
jgi:hypothetical protein